MQQQLDGRELMSRAGEVAKEIRKSEAYPALVGGVAGGVAGALIAAIIARRVSSHGANSTASPTQETRGGWAVKDVVQVLTVVATLARQVQAWMKEQEKK